MDRHIDFDREAPGLTTCAHPPEGTIRSHRSHGLPPWITPRRIRVWLPPGYDADPSRRHPTLWLQDGQNVLGEPDAGSRSWHAAGTTARLIAQGLITPPILVAIDHAGARRLDDYTPVRWLGRGGHADDYAQLLIAQIKPFVDRTYRTLPDAANTAIGGSSLGGLCALHVALRHPEVFGQVAALSPSLWWAHDWLPRLVASLRDRPPVRIWLDAGKVEAPELRRIVATTRDLLLDLGFRRHRQARLADLRCTEVAGGRHDEASWGRRFDRVLRFLFPPPGRRRRSTPHSSPPTTGRRRSQPPNSP